MNRVSQFLNGFSICSVSLLLSAVAFAGNVPNAVRVASIAAANDQVVEKSRPESGERVAVAVYEFRSGVYDIPGAAAADMLITTLVQNGHFRVVERSQINQNVLAEKQLGAQGLTTGEGAQTKLRGAKYILEGTISEANASENQRAVSFGIGGMSLTGGSNHDVVGIDLRIIDAATGDILDVITARKPIKSTSVGVSGVGNLVSTIRAEQGKSSPYMPDVGVQQQHKESVDETLRALIAETVTQLVARVTD